MIRHRITTVLLLLAFIATSAHAQTAPTFDITRLTTLYDSLLKKEGVPDANLDKRIADERARIRKIADTEVQEIVTPPQTDEPAADATAVKAYDKQRTLVTALEEKLREHKVDLNLLEEEEKRYYAPDSPPATVNDESRLTKTHGELLARKAVLEERIAALETGLPLQRDRLGKLQREQIFEQFAFLINFLSYLGIILGGVVIDRLIRRIIVGRIEEKGHRYLIAKILSAIIYAVMIAWVLTKLFSDHPGALASLAIVGAGIAVALQDVVKDVVGWMIIIQRRLFTLGDRISIGHFTGDVIDIGLMRTTMLEVSVAGLFHAHERTGKTLYIPNSLLLKEPVLNYNTTSDFMSVEMQATVSYESDWKKAETILKETLNAETAEFAEQARRQQRRRTALFYTAWEVSEPEVHVDLAENGILFTLKFTVPIGKRRTVVTNLSRSILEHFGAQYDVNLAFNTIRIVGEKPLQQPDA